MYKDYDKREELNNKDQKTPEEMKVDLTDSDTDSPVIQPRFLDEEQIRAAALSFVLQDTDIQPTDNFLNQLVGVRKFPKGSINIGKTLGHGAFGEVNLGEYQGRQVALKTFLPNMIKLDPEGFNRELGMMMDAEHPNIVRFYGVLQNTPLMLVMEFCNGGTLQSRLDNKEKSLSWKDRVQYAWDIALALAHLHHSGIVHRDVKADNILLHDHRAKLGDLGISHADALVANQETREKTLAKCFTLISPEEILDGTGNSGTESDIYAFGWLLRQMFYLEKPFENMAMDDIAAAVKRGVRYPLTGECLASWNQLIKDCWQQNPANRPTADQILLRLASIAKEIDPHSTLQLCQRLDGLIGEHRREFEDYQPPFTLPFSIQNADRYWGALEKQRTTPTSKNKKDSPSQPSHKGFFTRQPNSHGEKRSSKENETQDSNLESLDKVYQQFLLSTTSHVCVLYGDEGVGKTLSGFRLAEELLTKLYDDLHADKKAATKLWIPVFVRAGMGADSVCSLAALKDGIKKVLESYGLDYRKQEVRELPFVVIVDEYDTLQKSNPNQDENLPEVLNLDEFPNSKLIATCRRGVVPVHKENILFGWKSKKGVLTTRYLLTLRDEHTLNYLAQRLFWKPEERSANEKRLRQAPALFAELRNPLVLRLFAECLPTIQKKGLDFRDITRSKVFEIFIEHWINNYQALLDKDVITELERDIEGGLLQSFKQFARFVSFIFYWQRTISMDVTILLKHVMGRTEERSLLPIPKTAEEWVNLKKRVNAVSKQRHKKRLAELEAEGKQDKLMPLADYVGVMQSRAAHFSAFSPLKHRGGQLNFMHKSFFEYFMADLLLELCDADQALLTEVLNIRSLQEAQAHGIIGFKVEALTPQDKLFEQRKNILLTQIMASKKNKNIAQASANAFTILNNARVPWSGMNFDDVEIPGADGSFNIYDNTRFVNANMQGMAMFGVWMRQTNCTRANMQGAEFGEKITEFSTTPIVCLHSPSGSYFAVVTQSKLIKGEVTSCKLRIYSHDQHVCSFEETHDIIAVALHSNESLVATASTDHKVKLWSIATGELVGTFEGHRYSVTAVAFHPELNQMASGSLDKTIRLWDLSKISVKPSPLTVLEGHSDKITALIFYSRNENGQKKNWLISASADKTVIVWDLATRKKLHVFNKDKENWSAINAMALHPKTSQLALGGEDGLLRLVDVESHQEIYTYEGHNGAIDSVSFHPHHDQVASAGRDGVIRLWHISQHTLIQALEGHTTLVTSISFNPQNGELVSASADRTLRTWSINTRSRAHYENHEHEIVSVVAHPAQPWVISGGRDKDIFVWDVSKQCLVGTLRGHKDIHSANTTSLAFDSTGKWFISGGVDQTVNLWDAVNFKLIKKMVGHMSPVTAVAFHPKQALIFAGCKNGKIFQWKYPGGELREEITVHKQAIECIAVHPEGEWLASGSVDKTIVLRSIAAEKPIHILEGHTSTVLSLAFQPQGKWLVSAGADSTVRLWDMSNFQLAHVFMGHTKAVTSVAFHPAGKLIASGSADRTVRIWHTDTKGCKLTIQGFSNDVTTLSWMKNGENYFLVTGSKDKAVRYWEISKGADGQHLQAILRWSSCQTVFVAAEACIGETQGLNRATKSLFIQRGAYEHKQEPAVAPSLTRSAASRSASPALNSQASLIAGFSGIALGRASLPHAHGDNDKAISPPRQRFKPLTIT